jgi:2-polyprenyl-3-methyl-5-hydroxy-6-metoxy-1,4-benzoquinol methylase/predicted transcriptional regulator
MKIIPQSENPLEWLVMQTGFIPKPLLQAHFGFMMSKIIWEAIECNVLEAMANKPITAEDIAGTCNLNVKATTALLGALTGMHLVKFSNGKYMLTKASKKWLLKTSPTSYTAMMQFDNQVCYAWMEQANNFLKTGNGLQYHGQMTPQQWSLYQNGMTDIARTISKLVAQKIKLPNGPSAMLDIGGAQGIYASAMIDKNPQLTVTVMDLPEAIAAHSRKNHLRESKLVFRSGDILKDDIGQQQYDVVLMASVAHHFTDAENKTVARKVYVALKPGGSFFILEYFRKQPEAFSGDMIGSLQNFFFSFSSTSGLWDAAEMKTWLQKAQFKNIKTIHFLQLPGFGMVTGKRLENVY